MQHYEQSQSATQLRLHLLTGNLRVKFRLEDIAVQVELGFAGAVWESMR